MKLENQLTSIEPSIKLRELGVVQKSLFIYVKSEAHGIKPYYIETEFDLSEHIQIERVCSAYTVAELGVMLPYQLKSGSFLKCEKYDDTWRIEYNHSCFPGDVDVGDALPDEKTEADARANMLIYLLENKLIDVAEVNKALEG